MLQLYINIVVNLSTMNGYLKVSGSSYTVKNTGFLRIKRTPALISPKLGSGSHNDDDIFIEDSSVTETDRIDTKHTWHVFNGTKTFIEGLTIHENGWVSDTNEAYFIYDFTKTVRIEYIVFWTIFFENVKVYISNDNTFSEDDLIIENQISLYGENEWNGESDPKKSSGRYIKVLIKNREISQVSVQEIEIYGE